MLRTSIKIKNYLKPQRKRVGIPNVREAVCSWQFAEIKQKSKTILQTANSKLQTNVTMLEQNAVTMEIPNQYRDEEMADRDL